MAGGQCWIARLGNVPGVAESATGWGCSGRQVSCTAHCVPFGGFGKIGQEENDLGVTLTSTSNLYFSINYLIDIGQLT